MLTRTVLTFFLSAGVLYGHSFVIKLWDNWVTVTRLTSFGMFGTLLHTSKV